MSDEVKETTKAAKQQSTAELDAELKRLELEKLRLEVLEREANLRDLQERLNEREVAREDKGQKARTNGQTLKQNDAAESAMQSRCNHHKGGDGQRAIREGRGNDPQYAVIKHTMLNGDIWVRCTRCAKTWKPPIEENFYFDDKGNRVQPLQGDFQRLRKPEKGTFSVEKFNAAVQEYKNALEFETRNSPSGSYIFRFSDNGKLFRHVMNSVTLR